MVILILRIPLQNLYDPRPMGAMIFPLRKPLEMGLEMGRDRLIGGFGDYIALTQLQLDVTILQ